MRPAEKGATTGEISDEEGRRGAGGKVGKEAEQVLTWHGLISVVSLWRIRRTK